MAQVSVFDDSLDGGTIGQQDCVGIGLRADEFTLC